MAKDSEKSSALDVCNGHIDEIRGYHYHVTPGRFPYMLGGYAGVVEASNNRGLRGGQTGPLVDNTQQGENRMDKVIAMVRPGTASRGKIHSIELELKPENGIRHRVPSDKPNWVQIGPYEATSIKREGNVVTAEINISDDAPIGVLLDCHIEFAENGRSGPIVFKKNDVFRIAE